MLLLFTKKSVMIRVENEEKWFLNSMTWYMLPNCVVLLSSALCVPYCVLFWFIVLRWDILLTNGFLYRLIVLCLKASDDFVTFYLYYRKLKTTLSWYPLFYLCKCEVLCWWCVVSHPTSNCIIISVMKIDHNLIELAKPVSPSQGGMFTGMLEPSFI